VRTLKQLDINGSIKQEKLIFKESWLDKFDTITVYFVFGWATIVPFLVYFDPHRNKNETGLFHYLIFLMTFLSIYVIYRKATENKLIKITSSNTQELNRSLINEYCIKENFRKYRDTKDIIIYNEDADFNINPNWVTSYIFLLKDNNILFTIIKERYKVNLPTLTKHLVVKNDLRKILKNIDTPNS